MSNVYEAGTGAVRSNDLAHERWDLLSGAACRYLYLASDPEEYDRDPLDLVAEAIAYAQAFLGFDRAYGDDRLDILTRGWWKLSAAIQLLDAPEGELEGIVGHHYPYHALKRLARTLHEGAAKYGAHNWLHGFQVSDLANHLVPHLVSWQGGRRPPSPFWKGPEGEPLVEDELGHAMWGFMAITHMWLFRRDDLCKLLLGANYTITEELKAYHDEHASRRKADASPGVPMRRLEPGIMTRRETHVRL